ncbi:MAG: inositol oxygenase [Planctomycetaceae bacterium]|nr:inositol oxygenase [Planctomycetaceae bacterium]
MPLDNEPLQHPDQWDDDVRRRYAKRQSSARESAGTKAAFRDYDTPARHSVREFYRQNHERQTVAFNRRMRQQWLPLQTRRMSVWEAMEFLNELVDDSDPDTALPQIAHAMQTAEAIRADGHPDWFVLTGLIHDMGKVLCLFGEPQWAVVGDTFPVGCRWSDRIVYPELFAGNPDRHVERYQTRCGIYQEHCGLDQVMLSWGHDEYLYHVVRDHLPPEALAMIRYHSFYSAHREQEYDWLMNDVDRRMLDHVRAFNQYDLYTKTDEPPDVQRLTPYYRELVDRYFPGPLAW